MLMILFTITFCSCLSPGISQPSADLSTKLTTKTIYANRTFSVKKPNITHANSTTSVGKPKITASRNDSLPFTVDSTVQSIFLQTGSQGYACGLYCNGTCDSYLFAVVSRTDFPQVVWSPYRSNPVGVNASLNLTDAGDLVLRDADGSLAWSTNTAGKGVVKFDLTEAGNLVLFDANESVVWQSFDHPTDCLVPGQKLHNGKNLTASASSSNWSEGGLYSLSMTENGLVASILSDPPQVYYKYFSTASQETYAEYQNGSLALYISVNIPIPSATSSQYMKLGPDGHVRVFEWKQPWQEVADLLHQGDCNYPMSCGRYGICSNGQCSCPGSSFRQINDRLPNLGCSEMIPLTCNASENHTFLDLNDVTYFTFVPIINNTDVDRCKEACLKNCSCKAALFRSLKNSSIGECYLPTEIFSLMNNEEGLTQNSFSVSLKVQSAASSTPETFPTGPKGKTSSLGPILGSILGTFLPLVIIVTGIFVYSRKRKYEHMDEEDYLDHVPGMPTRFTFEELTSATDNFSNKLGAGGFGSVFYGLLNDGTKIAVKTLDGVGHIKKSFLAEVETIGSIHHINLVRLIGFCADKSRRLLVYEYMPNGSLEKWIYCRSEATPLGWEYRRKIILDVAKGLAYLHEDCRQKIIHLDIKPQNILLDEHYNAKLADFGLSKLIDRNQIEVVTTMRGTPGYLAPEWLSAVITEKVDVYSFGVVVLEIVSGRKIFEQSRPEEERYLLTLFKNKAEEGKMLELVDKCCMDVEAHVAELEKMMEISAWCLQSDHEKRPSMAMVVKVIEGDKDVRRDIDCNFLISTTSESSSKDATPVLASVLSGPR